MYVFCAWSSHLGFDTAQLPNYAKHFERMNARPAVQRMRAREAAAEKLVGQAILQHARKTGEPAFELRPAQPGKGFELLPRPQAGDLFYDIEGDPHYEGGLEYLHGVWADDSFHAF